MTPKQKKNSTQPEQHEWGYDKHGTDWPCKGQEQSPIDIVTTNVIPSPCHHLKLWWNKDPVKTKVVDNGHTLMVNAPLSRVVGVNDDRKVELFEAIQFHFHDPSEHTIDGKQYPLELHIVHTLLPDHFDEGVKRNAAVVGIFFEVNDDKPNAFIDSLKLDSIGSEIEIDPAAVLGQVREPEFYSYKGSLTTPPCSELVNWFVLAKPLTLTTEQLNLFSGRWEKNTKFASGNGNNRETQNLNGREVFLGNCPQKFQMHSQFI